MEEKDSHITHTHAYHTYGLNTNAIQTNSNTKEPTSFKEKFVSSIGERVWMNTGQQKLLLYGTA